MITVNFFREIRTNSFLYFYLRNMLKWKRINCFDGENGKEPGPNDSLDTLGKSKWVCHQWEELRILVHLDFWKGRLKKKLLLQEKNNLWIKVNFKSSSPSVFYLVTLLCRYLDKWSNSSDIYSEIFAFCVSLIAILLI